MEVAGARKGKRSNMRFCKLNIEEKKKRAHELTMMRRGGGGGCSSSSKLREASKATRFLCGFCEEEREERKRRTQI